MNHEPEEPEQEASPVYAGMPSWVKIVFALGFPAFVCIILLWFVLNVLQKQYDAISSTITTNQVMIREVDRKMTLASESMARFVVSKEKNDEAVIQLLYRICTQNASTTTQMDNCYKATRGVQ